MINGSYDEKKVEQAVAEALENFYRALINKIDSINISDILKSKNPYLYRAKAMQTAAEIIESIMQAFVSSSEETIFGNTFFEPIAIAASNGKKSLAEGIDIDIVDDDTNTQYGIAVKSGTSVFNADSKKRQEENFKRAQKLATQGKRRFEAIVGYAYGTKQDSGRGYAKIYQEIAGEEFWTAITGDKDFYKKIISYMGQLPEKYIDEYKTSYARAANRLIKSFSSDFCLDDGSIDWEKLVDYNSGSPVRKAKEKLLADAQFVFDFLLSNPKASKKMIAEELSLKTSEVNKALDFLITHEDVTKGYEGKKTGWTVLKQFNSEDFDNNLKD